MDSDKDFILIILLTQTGKSKHYAFIEFDSSTVAKIVAETMDNYLIMGHILRCKVIPKEEVHPGLWVGANRKWRVVPRDRVVRVQHNKVCQLCVLWCKHLLNVFLVPVRGRTKACHETPSATTGATETQACRNGD